MKPKNLTLLLSFIIAFSGFAQNPLIRDQFTADPTARVFGDRVYVFPSHDFFCTEEKGRPGWFCMEDYHVFSSDNLTDWTDHGMIVSQADVSWNDDSTYSMWAPDCIYHNDKYYFYYPSIIGDTTKYWRGFGIGVAVADQPEGPYEIQPDPIDNVRGIDPNIFIDKDGQAYLYWSGGHIYGAKLKENMLELASEPVILGDLPPRDKGLKEGPYVIERNGMYYMTYPHVENRTERLEYAIGDNPLGPFEIKGVIMDEWANGCWTNHHSLVNYEEQWYLFYHHNDYSPNFDKNRSICADSLFFNEDGTIQKVIPTLRGIGVTDAMSKIQLDRYTSISENASIDLLDSTNTFLGWKTILKGKSSVRYNAVDFSANPSIVEVKVKSMGKGTLELKTASGISIAKIPLKNTSAWTTLSSSKVKTPKGKADLIVSTDSEVEIDWVRFGK